MRRWLAGMVLCLALEPGMGQAAVAEPLPAVPLAELCWSPASNALQGYSVAGAEPERPSLLNPALASAMTVGFGWLPFGVSFGYLYAGEPGRGFQAGFAQYGLAYGGAFAGGLLGAGLMVMGADRLLPESSRGPSTGTGLILVSGAVGLLVGYVGSAIWDGFDVYHLVEQKNAAALAPEAP